MKKRGGQSLFRISRQKNLCSLAVTIAAFFLCSETASLKGKQLVLSGQTNKRVSLNNHDVPELCMFTVCVDLNRTETVGGSWTAYSYDTTNTRGIELALSAEKDVLKVYILDAIVTLQISFSPHKMHRVCCVWDGNKHLLELFHDGDKMRNLTLPNTTAKCLSPHGTLLMGQLHQNINGHVDPLPACNFVGILHYFQMWDHVRDQQEMIQCQPGNVVSWQGNYWSFNDMTTAPDLHQRCGETEPMPVPPPPPPTIDVPDFWTSPGSPVTTTSKSQGTPISPTAHSDMVTTILSSSVTTTTPKTEVTPSDNVLSGMPSGTVPSHNPQQTISTSKTDGTTPIRTPTSIPATSMPYLNTLTSGFSGTTSKFVTPISTSKPGETTQLYPTVSVWTWSDSTSQYGGSTPKHSAPTSKPTHTPSTSRHHGSVQQSDTTALTTQQLVTTKPVSRSKATTTSISVQTTPLPSQSLPVSDTFYNIQMNFSVSSKSPKPFDYYDAVVLSRNWLIKICHNSEFVVTNHNIKRSKAIFPQGSLQMRAKLEEKQEPVSYFSKSVVKATSDQTTKVLEKELQNMLRGYHEEGDLIMDPQNAAVTHFDPGTCLGSVVQTKYKGTYRWPETSPVNTVKLCCERYSKDSASRTCLINVDTRRAFWRSQNLTACPLLEDLPKHIVGLHNVTIMDENAEDVANHILTLLNFTEEGKKLSKEEMQILIDKLDDIAGCKEISQTLATKTLKIINIIITRAGNIQDLQQMVNRIFTIIEQIGFKVDFTGQKFSIVLPSLALALLRPDPMSFQGIIFGVTSYDPKTDPEFDICQVPFESLASVSLPGLLRKYLKVQSFQPENHTEIQFSFFGTPSLFEEHKNSSFKNAKLNSYVVGASIENTSVQNLEEPVNITLKHIQQNVNNFSVHCVFWDFTENGGLGGWNTSGCKIYYTDTNYTVCVCYHLTHFGVLLDLSREPTNEADNRVLTMISYVGCGISCIFLGLALAVYLSIDKLCGDYPSQILVNLCFALLMLNLVYLVNSWLASFHSHGLCIAVASALHYFLLAAFTWMGLEAIHMYYALVKVFSTYIPNYMIKLCIVGWGIPAVIVAIILIVGKDIEGKDFYGTGLDCKRNNPSMPFCWIQNDIVFYVSVVAYFCLVFLTNIAMFITVILQIQTMKARHHRGQAESWHRSFRHDLKRVASLSCLLGLTWGFAFFAWGPVEIFFTYLFAICNTLQGFFIFVFHCLMKENVRKQSQMNFCCGRFRLSYLEGSVSATTLGYPSRNLKRKPSSHSLRSLKSCATTSTSNSSGGLPGASPNISLSVSWLTSCTPLSCQSIKLPRVRSSMDIELCQTHKTGLLS